ncbi:YopX family protein [Clostridium felsineum]|uniref:YopX family protein n=1 Tax=Clostridium felsineum TaxID=36839 RepID=UPI00098C548C|nr:YopX family protein [Clostridium felsineum]URZ15307.1 hypothetical protein CLFE_013250 [Clostridium felsineum DSM 794]
MRKIKFKFWDKEKNRMYDETPEWAIGCTGEVSRLKYHDSNAGDCVEWEGTYYSKHIIPLEYTGIKDDKGYEICEGDIVLKTSMLVSNVKPFKGKVEFSEGSWWIDNGKDAIKLFTECDELEKLGNIYQDPELLKE